MKRKESLLFKYILLALIICNYSCDFNFLTKKENESNSILLSNGVTADEVQIQVNGQIESRNIFIQGEKVTIVFKNIEGLKEINGKVYPDYTLTIVQSEVDTLHSSRKSQAETNQGLGYDPLQLEFTFFADFPYDKGQDYKAIIEIKDNEGIGSMQFILPFEILENNLFDIRHRDLLFEDFYLWNETRQVVVVDNEIDASHVYLLIFEGVDGFNIIDNKVYPSLSLDISDDSGNKVLHEKSLLGEDEQGGMEYSELKERKLYTKITFPNTIEHQLMNLVFLLEDTKSSGFVEVKGSLIIKESQTKPETENQ